jgi:hypothetical protein
MIQAVLDKAGLTYLRPIHWVLIESQQRTLIIRHDGLLPFLRCCHQSFKLVQGEDEITAPADRRHGVESEIESGDYAKIGSSTSNREEELCCQRDLMLDDHVVVFELHLGSPPRLP